MLSEHFRSVPLMKCYSSLKENFPHLRRHDQMILVLLGSTYTRSVVPKLGGATPRGGAEL